MPTRVVEVYTADAVITGAPVDGDAREQLESGDRLQLHQSDWTPLRASASRELRQDWVAVDDIVMAIVPVEPTPPIHANRHDVILEAGPYRIAGSLAVLPGFDPGRALARPGSTFLQLHQARLTIIDQPEAGELEREQVLVNRYAVDRVASDMVLTFFFPAARFETLEGVPAG